MFNYILKRLLLMIPTLLGIMVINFIIVQAAPGGPVEQMIFRLTQPEAMATDRIGMGAGSDMAARQSQTGGQMLDARSRGARGLDPEIVAQIEKMYGFDKPAHERFFKMLGDYARFDFGESF